MSDYLHRGATFGKNERYRYALWRVWDANPTCMFLMLNPSTADERNNDPTVERCERRAREWGYGALEVCNIFALRSTDPGALYDHPNPVGDINDEVILVAARKSAMVVCGWGKHGNLHGRGNAVLKMLVKAGIAPYALRVNLDGTPGHPLYIPYTQLPFMMRID